LRLAAQESVNLHKSLFDLAITSSARQFYFFHSN